MKPGWLTLTTLLWASASLAGWPAISAPPHSSIEDIGRQVRLNGVPMRMQRVLSSATPKEIIAFYREALGPRHAEEKLPDGRLLSQGRGDYFLTVRVKALGPSLTESLLSISDARAARYAAGRPLGIQLPSDTQLVSDMESTDDGKVSRQLVFLNEHSIDANVNFVTRTLRAQGYQPQPGDTRNTANGRVLMFEGENREAQLVAVHKDGLSNVVLTTVLMP